METHIALAPDLASLVVAVVLWCVLTQRRGERRLVTGEVQESLRRRLSSIRWRRSDERKMSAQEQMRAMLDQLMGTARNGERELIDRTMHREFLSLRNRHCAVFDRFSTMSLNFAINFSISGETDQYHVKFSDSSVCKSFLLGCCPHEILLSTVCSCSL